MAGLPLVVPAAGSNEATKHLVARFRQTRNSSVGRLFQPRWHAHRLGQPRQDPASVGRAERPAHRRANAGPYGYGASSVSLSPDGTRIVSGKCRQDAAALGPCVVNQPNSLPCNHTGNVKVTCVACRRILRLFVQVTHEFDFKPEPAIRMRVTQRRKKRVASIQFCIDATPSATWLFQCLNYPPASCDGAVLAL